MLNCDPLKLSIQHEMKNMTKEIPKFRAAKIKFQQRIGQCFTSSTWTPKGVQSVVKRRADTSPY